jgi:lipopolysaccharide export system protein LptC
LSTARRFWRAWDRLSLYLPIILMGVLALGTYWLARNTPLAAQPGVQQAPTHEPDYFMRRFSVRSFDPGGRLKSEIFGAEARHYPDTDTMEIDQPRIRAFNPQGILTVATAKKAVSNADGSQVQLIGDAVVTRAESKGARGQVLPPMEIRGEFLHAFLDKERVVSHKPVKLIRGGDVFEAERLDYDNLDRVLQLTGRVRGVLQPGGATGKATP